MLSAMFSGFQHMENTLPVSSNLTTKELVGWIVYQVLTIPMLYLPPDQTKRLYYVMNIVSFITLLSMMIWALSAAHGGGPLLSEPASVAAGSELGWAITKGVTTVIGNIAVGLSKYCFCCPILVCQFSLRVLQVL